MYCTVRVYFQVGVIITVHCTFLLYTVHCQVMHCALLLTLLQDDIALIALKPEGLRTLLQIVQSHCSSMKMTVSISKSKVMTNSDNDWNLFDGEEKLGSLETVNRFKYLGMETMLSPVRGAALMRKRAISLARRYKGACMNVSRSGPDVSEVALTTWRCIAIPSILFGCESVPFSPTFMDEVDRIQSAVAKDILGLDFAAPNVAAQAILGLKTFRHKVYETQLKFYLRVNKLDVTRWSRDAMECHLSGRWVSPYMAHITRVKMEVGMVVGPVSVKHIDLVLDYHFIRKTNERIKELNLPALHPIDAFKLREHVGESEESQVLLINPGKVIEKWE